MAAARITSVDMHAKLGAVIDRAVIEPVIVTKHGRDHLVMLSAERYAALVAAVNVTAVRQRQSRVRARKTMSG